MKNFWLSLFIFILLMCSCRSKKFDSNVRMRNEIRSDLSYFNESVKIDTSRTAYLANEAQNIVIEEDITVIEYDKESGKPVKETKTKRKAVQDSDKVVSTEEEKRVYEASNDSLNHIVQVHEMVDEEMKEESKGGQEAFGKWLGIVIGCLICFLVVYLLRKLRVY